MVSSNYEAGVRLEREIVKLFKESSWGACRTAGSHGKYDVIAWTFDPQNVTHEDFILSDAGWKIVKGEEYDLIAKKSTRQTKYKLLMDIVSELDFKYNETRVVILIQCKRSKI